MDLGLNLKRFSYILLFTCILCDSSRAVLQKVPQSCLWFKNKALFCWRFIKVTEHLLSTFLPLKWGAQGCLCLRQKRPPSSDLPTNVTLNIKEAWSYHFMALKTVICSQKYCLSANHLSLKDSDFLPVSLLLPGYKPSCFHPRWPQFFKLAGIR